MRAALRWVGWGGWAVALAVLGSGCVKGARAPVPEREQPEVMDCVSLAKEEAAGLYASGAGQDAVLEHYKQQREKCEAEQPLGCAKEVIQRVNREREALGQAFMEGQLSSAQYTAASRSLTAKSNALLKNKALETQCEKEADADRDLVVNSVDKCPATARFTPTDDRGCPLERLPRDSFDAALARQVLNEGILMFNPACEGAPVPNMPTPVAWGRAPKYKDKRFVFVTTRVKNQPAGCEVFYELRVRLSNFAGGLNPLPETSYSNVIFRGSEDLTQGGNTAIFGVGLSDTDPNKMRLDNSLGRYLRVQWQVRAVNGNGLTSAWSRIVLQPSAASGIP